MLDWRAFTFTTTLTNLEAPGPHSAATVSAESHGAAMAAE
jgi:hypothetical protein